MLIWQKAHANRSVLASLRQRLTGPGKVKQVEVLFFFAVLHSLLSCISSNQEQKFSFFFLMAQKNFPSVTSIIEKNIYNSLG